MKDWIIDRVERFFILLFDLILLNLYFVLAAIPFITLGADLVALDHALLRRAWRRDCMPYPMDDFGDVFMSSWGIGILLLAIPIAIFSAFLACEPSPAVTFIQFAGVVMITTVTIPVRAWYGENIIKTYARAIYITFRYLPLTVLCGVITAAPFFSTLLPEPQMERVMILYCVFGISLTSWMKSYIFRYIFEKEDAKLIAAGKLKAATEPVSGEKKVETQTQA